MFLEKVVFVLRSNAVPFKRGGGSNNEEIYWTELTFHTFGVSNNCFFFLIAEVVRELFRLVLDLLVLLVLIQHDTVCG